jgi:hypothetical protein
MDRKAGGHAQFLSGLDGFDPINAGGLTSAAELRYLAHRQRFRVEATGDLLLQFSNCSNVTTCFGIKDPLL